MKSVEQLLRERVVIDPATGCWDCTLATNGFGYTQVWYGGRAVRTHRFVYEHPIGPIPLGLQIDHLCRNRRCCNPAHLEPVTPAENQRRGLNPRYVTQATGVCQRGHSMADALVYADGGRRCRGCHNQRNRESKQRKRQA